LSPPEIDVVVAGDPRFRTRARYTFAMLGLIANFRPRFVPDVDPDRPSITYAPPGEGPRGLVHLPSSLAAQGFLLARGSFARLGVAEVDVFGTSILSLFPVEERHLARPMSERGEHLATDIVAAAFFFLSLHEEWSSIVRDRFGRFPYAESFLGSRGEFARPAVAEYAAALRELLHRSGTKLPAAETRFSGRRAAACITHDIDYFSKATPGLVYRETWKYLVRGATGRPVAERTRRFREYAAMILSGSDPYPGSMRAFLDEEGRRGIRATWFLKAGGNDARDVSYRIRSTRFMKILRRIVDERHEIGLHPSYRTPEDAGKLSREKETLESVLRRPVHSVRQHYLRFSYPDTWNDHVRVGMDLDCTLGFAEHEGFRNGTCHPFLAFDAETDRVLPLWAFPLHAMDGTLAWYRGMAPDGAAHAISGLLDVIQRHAGVAGLLFHNVAYDPHDFPGWDAVFESTLDSTVRLGMYAGTTHECLASWLESSGFRDTREILDTIHG
jgi:hypothetical protein